MIKILSIDGGGIRGIIPAIVLAEIERRTERPIAQPLRLDRRHVHRRHPGARADHSESSASAPLYTAGQLIEMYEREGARIFSRSLVHAAGRVRQPAPRRNTPRRASSRVLLDYFADSRLRAAATDVLITSYEIERSFPFFFRSAIARDSGSDYDFPARDVARATSAAPTYFAPMKLPTGTNDDHYTLIDGGVFANNPAACALVEARATHPEANDFLVVSLGTGELNRPLPYERTKDWGVVHWAMPVLDVVFDGVSRTVDYQLRQLLPDTAEDRKRYYRFQTTLGSQNYRLDNTSPENIRALTVAAEKLVERESPNIENLCEELTKNAKS